MRILFLYLFHYIWLQLCQMNNINKLLCEAGDES